MNKKLITLFLAAGMAVIFAATGLQAKTQVNDTFKMKTDGYKKRKKGEPKYKLVEFTHKKHIEDHKIACGECHHDDKGQPLNDLKMSDSVKKCQECHNQFKTNKKNKKDIKVHKNAIHKNCVGCHKAVNKKAGDKKGTKGPAPASCGKCHKKNKK